MSAVTARTRIEGPRRRARLAALAFVFLIAFLALARTPAHAADAQASALSLTAAPATSFQAAADPCSAIPISSVKKACENFGKPGSGSSGPSLTDVPGQVEQAIDTWFGNLVKSALTPVMTLLGKLVLATPDLDIGRIRSIWAIVLGIADACFVLLAVVGGVVVMTHESVQSRYGLKQILPRLVFAFIAANSSLLVIDQLVSFGNAVTLAVWNQPVSGPGIGNQLLGYIMASIFTPDGVTQVFTILFGLVLAVMALAVLFSFAMRTAALLLVVILAPLMLACHALPGIDAIAQLWWRALAAVLAIEFLQATVLMLMMQIFFDPDSNILGVPTATGLVDLLLCGVLFVILLKIPGWVMRTVLGRAPRSTAMGLVRTAAMAALGTAVGVPGATSARALAGRVAGRAVSGGLGSGPPSAGSARPGRPGTARAARAARPARAKFGTAHGRPGPGGQGVLFPLPPGSRTERATAQAAAAEPIPQAPATSGPGWVQPPLFPDPARFGTAHGRPGPGGQGALFPIPTGARRAQQPAPEPVAEPDRTVRRGPGWVQPPLFPAAAPGPIRARRQALFPLPPGAKQPRPTPAPGSAAGAAQAAAPRPRTGPRTVQPGLFPRSGLIAPPPVARPVGTAPSTAGRVPQAPPNPVARVVPVRLAAPPPLGKRGRRSKPTSKGGDGS